MNKFRIVPNKKFLDEVRPVVMETLKKCEKVIRPLQSYSVIIMPTYSQFVIEKLNGSAGHTHNSQIMYIEANTQVKNWKGAVKSSSAHEFNHITRLQYANSDLDTYTLLDSLAFEGLGQIFEEEIVGQTPKYATTVPKSEIKKVWMKIKPNLAKLSREFYWRLYHDRESKEFPLWAGYALSYSIVKMRWQESGLSWPELMKLDSKTIIGKGLD